MDKKECIIEYARKQIPKELSELGFSLVKTRDQFIKAYTMHDVATDYAAKRYLQDGFSLYPLGVDLRERRLIIENELPDFLVEKDDILFCFDAKSKSSTETFGWINERAVISYRKLAKQCSVQVYLTFVHVAAGKVLNKTGNSDIEDEPINIRYAWGGNTVWVFSYEEGLPFIG